MNALNKVAVCWAFNQAIDESLRWLETASSEMVSFSEECDGEFAELREALSRLTQVRTELQAVREPLSQQIKTAEAQHSKEEASYGE